MILWHLYASVPYRCKTVLSTCLCICYSWSWCLWHISLCVFSQRSHIPNMIFTWNNHLKYKHLTLSCKSEIAFAINFWSNNVNYRSRVVLIMQIRGLISFDVISISLRLYLCLLNIHDPSCNFLQYTLNVKLPLIC